MTSLYAQKYMHKVDEKQFKQAELINQLGEAQTKNLIESIYYSSKSITVHLHSNTKKSVIYKLMTHILKKYNVVDVTYDYSDPYRLKIDI